MNDYYSVKLKKDRIKKIQEYSKSSKNNSFTFQKVDISKKKSLENIFSKNKFEIVINLAAQAGVRYSFDNSEKYLISNLVGFHNLLECCRRFNIEHFLFASSSSVYGMSSKIPFLESDKVDTPVSFYAATKISNESMAFSYSHLYGIPTTGIRFFTVYGPYGRPDMAYFSFVKSISLGKKIELFNNGNLKRDFTYIDDLISGMAKIVSIKPTKKIHPPSQAMAPYDIYNLGNNKPITLNRFVRAIENVVGKKAIIKKVPMQPGDVKVTFADIEKAKSSFNFSPQISIEEGMKRFYTWYNSYYK